MRRLLLLFIVFFQLSFFLSAQVTLDQLVEKNGIYYKKGETTPYSGVVADNWSDEIKKYEGLMKNGKFDKQYTEWYD